MTTALQSSLSALEETRDYPITTDEVLEALDAVQEFCDKTHEGAPVHTDVVEEWLYHNRGFTTSRDDYVSFARYIEQQHGISRV